MIFNSLSGGAARIIPTEITTSGAPNQAYFDAVASLPTQDPDGNDYNVRLTNIPEYALFARKMFIPAYFTYLQSGYYGTGQPFTVKEIEYAGNATTFDLGSIIERARNLDTLIALNQTGNIGITGFAGGESTDESRENYKIVIPKATGFNYMWCGGGADKLVTMSPDCRFDAVTVWGATSYASNDGGRWLNGTVVLPSCEKIDSGTRCPGSGTMIWKLPKLKTSTDPSYAAYAFTKYDGGDTGTVKVYIGADLEVQHYTGLGNAYVEVHIPAGDSTTKTTLDAQGVSYIQDYNYTEDLVS